MIDASTLAALMKDEHRLGANQQVRLANINAQLQEFQDAQRPSSRMPELRPQDLITDGWYQMGGPLIKASNTRQIMPCVEIIARRYMGDDAYGRSIVRLVTSLNKVYEVLYNADCFLDAAELEALGAALVEMGREHMRCRQYADALGEPAFQVRPKAHYAQHLHQQARLINPRFTQCYKEESMMGTTSNIYHNTCNGPYKKTIQRVVLMK